MQDSPFPEALNDSHCEWVVSSPPAVFTEDGFHKFLSDAFKAVTEVNVDTDGANHGVL